jgi:hypothetical protein
MNIIRGGAMKTRSLVVLAALAISSTSAWVISCSGSKASPPDGGSSTSGSSGTTSGVSFEHAHDRCIQLATASCQHDVACGYLSQGDIALCEATWDCDNTVAENIGDEQVDAGKASVSATAIEDCVNDITNAPCGETGGTAYRHSSNCDQIARGPTQGGGYCETGSDCLPAYSCVRSTTACGGTCQAWSTSGPCGLGYPGVAIGYFCALDGGVIPQVGQGASCDADYECVGTLVCSGLTNSRTCQPFGTLSAGAPCLGTHTCAPSLACIGFRADAGGTCIARSTVGSDCTWHLVDGGVLLFRDGGAQPVDSLCGIDSYCDPISLLCTGQAVLGGGCATDGGNPACLEGICVPASDGSGHGSCNIVGDGQPCQVGTDCASGYCAPAGDGGGACGATCP